MLVILLPHPARDSLGSLPTQSNRVSVSLFSPLVLTQRTVRGATQKINGLGGPGVRAEMSNTSKVTPSPGWDWRGRCAWRERPPTPAQPLVWLCDLP